MSRQQITESEYEIMKILWGADEPLSMGEIYKGLSGMGKSWSKNTAATLLSRLCEKGVCAYEKRGTHHYYYPVIEKKDYSTDEAKSFISKLFGGSVKNMVASLYENDELSKKDIEELKELFGPDKQI